MTKFAFALLLALASPAFGGSDPIPITLVTADGLDGYVFTSKQTMRAYIDAQDAGDAQQIRRFLFDRDLILCAYHNGERAWLIRNYGCTALPPSPLNGQPRQHCFSEVATERRATEERPCRGMVSNAHIVMPPVRQPLPEPEPE